MCGSPRHVSVLLDRVVQSISRRNSTPRILIDGTLGAGGYSLALLKQFPSIELLIGIDRDLEAIDIAKDRLSNYKAKVKFVHSNYKDIDKVCHELDIVNVDGMVLDLGVSSMQLDQANRGFSFMREGPLDMRMDGTSSKTASQLLEELSSIELSHILVKYGGEDPGRADILADVIIREHSLGNVNSTLELANLCKKVFSQSSRLHPATLVFQGLRIAVNEELSSLEEALTKIPRVVKGPVTIVSFQQDEDVIVHSSMHSWKAAGKAKYKGKLIRPRPNEVSMNPRSRSARLRSCTLY